MICFIFSTWFIQVMVKEIPESVHEREHTLDTPPIQCRAQCTDTPSKLKTNFHSQSTCWNCKRMKGTSKSLAQTVTWAPDWFRDPGVVRKQCYLPCLCAALTNLFVILTCVPRQLLGTRFFILVSGSINCTFSLSDFPPSFPGFQKHTETNTEDLSFNAS